MTANDEPQTSVLDPGQIFEVFFDGDCPLCKREIDFLRRRDRAGRIRFTDISTPDFDPASVGSDMATLMGRIHGRMPDGRLIEGLEVFRQLYDAVGFGPLVRLSRMPGVSALAERAYSLFARNRLRWTGRGQCESGVCATYTEAYGNRAREASAP